MPAFSPSSYIYWPVGAWQGCTDTENRKILLVCLNTIIELIKKHNILESKSREEANHEGQRFPLAIKRQEDGGRHIKLRLAAV